MRKCLSAYLICHLLFISATIAGEKKWSGALSTSWLEPLNWQPTGIPGETDDLLFDNSLQQVPYTVSLPNDPVMVHFLAVLPGQGMAIRIQIPQSNIKSPALTILSGELSFIIGEGAIFINSSGLASGQSIRMNGLMKIENGGRYIHNTRAIHATDIVAKLLVDNTAEQGIFEFDVPGGAYPVSLSNRTFGSLTFSSAASGGSQTYNASGSNILQVHGNLEMRDGVQLNLDMVNDVIISGDYIQMGGTLNLASQPNKNRLIIKGDIRQESDGVITETSTGQPVLELSGSRPQQVLFSGSIVNEVGIVINNAQGIFLQHELRVPFILKFMVGKIKSSGSARLVILDGGSVTGASADAFVDGPVEKIGGGEFLFPVGKQRNFASIKISGGGESTDSFVAEYFLADPAQAYGDKFDHMAMVRISMLEYWKLERPRGLSSKKMTLTVGAYSGATALDKLIVVGWNSIESRWETKGNTAYTGITAGTLTSEEVKDFAAFTVGSTVIQQNPLPLYNKDLNLPPVRMSPSNEPVDVESINRVSICIRASSAAIGNNQYRIYDLQGRLVSHTKQRVVAGFNRHCVDISTLAQGMYVIAIQGVQGNRKTVAFVKR